MIQDSNAKELAIEKTVVETCCTSDGPRVRCRED